jgi:hypothetical protein
MGGTDAPSDTLLLLGMFEIFALQTLGIVKLPGRYAGMGVEV